MREQLISFETAKLAKEKGFSEATPYFLYPDGSIGCLSNIGEFNPNCTGDWNNTVENRHKDKISAPTQSLLQKWLREEYNLEAFAHSNVGGLYNWFLFDKKEESKNVYSADIDEDYSTYEEALEKGLQEALKLINLQNQIEK